MQLIVILLKKSVYDKVVTNVNTIETSEFVLKMQYNTNKLYLEKKIDYADTNIANTSGHVKKIDNHSKITEIEGKIPGITGLATAAAMTSVENKIPNVTK